MILNEQLLFLLIVIFDFEESEQTCIAHPCQGLDTHMNDFTTRVSIIKYHYIPFDSDFWKSRLRANLCSSSLSWSGYVLVYLVLFYLIKTLLDIWIKVCVKRALKSIFDSYGIYWRAALCRDYILVQNKTREWECHEYEYLNDIHQVNIRLTENHENLTLFFKGLILCCRESKIKYKSREKYIKIIKIYRVIVG